VTRAAELFDMHGFLDGWLAPIITGEDNGKVSLTPAKVAGMSDFLVVPAPHPFIMDRDEVIEQPALRPHKTTLEKSNQKHYKL